ncbi:MAG: B-box zinc finger protein [Bryobacteraceae bacterium]
MTCYLHPDAAAVAFCRTCGRPLCAACKRSAEGTVFCSEHVPANPYAAPAVAAERFAPPRVQNSPALAFILGWIPGVGAIYNAQYIKGLVHAIIFGLIISLLNSTDHTAGQPLLAMLLVGFIFYMPFEAYHTARKRQRGVAVDEWSSFASPRAYTRRTPVGPMLLICIGVLFLLDSLHLVEFRDIGRFWPVLLIVWGAFMLYSRLSAPPLPPRAPDAPPPPAKPRKRNYRTFAKQTSPEGHREL